MVLRSPPPASVVAGCILPTHRTGGHIPLHDSPPPPRESVEASCTLPTVLDVMVYTVARYRVPSPTEMDEAALPVEDATDS